MSAAADPPGPSPSGSHATDTARTAARAPLFQERLLPGAGGWVLVLTLGAVCGVVLLPLSYPLAVGVGLGAMVVACVLAFLTSPTLTVTEDRFTMGRARIEVELLGEPTVLEGEDWRTTMGTGFEPLAHHLIRGWIHSGIRAAVLDENDRATAWVCSSRRPQDLALALRTAQRSAPAA